MNELPQFALKNTYTQAFSTLHTLIEKDVPTDQILVIASILGLPVLENYQHDYNFLPPTCEEESLARLLNSATVNRSPKFHTTLGYITLSTKEIETQDRIDKLTFIRETSYYRKIEI